MAGLYGTDACDIPLSSRGFFAADGQGSSRANDFDCDAKLFRLATHIPFHYQT